MLQLKNRTPYAAERAILLDKDGGEIWVVCVKATFDIKNGRPILAEKQEPVCLADEYHGEPGRSSMKYENELVFNKPGTDIVLNGHAYAPGGRPLKELTVSLKLDRMQKTIRVYGDRVWSGSVIGLSISDPKPFTKMPIVYERAFGGRDLNDQNPKNHGAEDWNPVGVGFGMSKDFLKGKPLPNCEDPKDEIQSWKSRTRPAGFGLICKHWMPRRQYAGTCDQRWMEERLPLYPEDFDFRFFLGAHPDLIAVPHLRGGEQVELQHLTPEGRLAFSLPKITLGFQTLLAEKWVHHRATLGSVIIEPDQPRVMLIWQSSIRCHRRKFELEETRIFEKRELSWN